MIIIMIIINILYPISNIINFGYWLKCQPLAKTSISFSRWFPLMMLENLFKKLLFKMNKKREKILRLENKFLLKKIIFLLDIIFTQSWRDLRTMILRRNHTGQNWKYYFIFYTRKTLDLENELSTKKMSTLYQLVLNYSLWIV